MEETQSDRLVGSRPMALTFQMANACVQAVGGDVTRVVGLAEGGGRARVGPEVVARLLRERRSRQAAGPRTHQAGTVQQAKGGARARGVELALRVSGEQVARLQDGCRGRWRGTGGKGRREEAQRLANPEPRELRGSSVACRMHAWPARAAMQGRPQHAGRRHTGGAARRGAHPPDSGW